MCSRSILRLSNLGISIGRTDLANDVIPLAEESVPLVQHGLVLVFEVCPLGDAVFGLQAGGGKGARGILAGKDCSHSVNAGTGQGEGPYRDTARLARRRYSG